MNMPLVEPAKNRARKASGISAADRPAAGPSARPRTAAGDRAAGARSRPPSARPRRRRAAAGARGSVRRSADRPAATSGCSTRRRVQPMLAKVEPALAVKQAADLHHAHVVVGVAEAEEADLVPTRLKMNQAQKREPDERARPTSSAARAARAPAPQSARSCAAAFFAL